MLILEAVVVSRIRCFQRASRSDRRAWRIVYASVSLGYVLLSPLGFKIDNARRVFCSPRDVFALIATGYECHGTTLRSPGNIPRLM